MAIKKFIVGIGLWLLLVLIIAFSIVAAFDGTERIYESRSLRVVATDTVQVTVETPDGQRLKVANSNPYIRVGYYVAMEQNEDGGWDIVREWAGDPR
jgi:hypothetical protein